MTFKVNIEHGISLYTTDELISYGLSGCPYVGETDLIALVEQIVTHYETKCLAGQMSVDEAEEEAYSRGRNELLDEIKNYLENI